MKSIRDFINYWYFRYLLVTELYMVEKWERTMFHIIVFLLLTILYLFNTTVVVGLVKMGTKFLITQEGSKGGKYLTSGDNYSEL